MNAIPLAAISGENLVNAVIWICVAGVIYWLLGWLIKRIGPPEPVGKIADVVLAIALVVLLINALLTVVGRGFINF